MTERRRKKNLKTFIGANRTRGGNGNNDRQWKKISCPRRMGSGSNTDAKGIKAVMVLVVFSGAAAIFSRKRSFVSLSPNIMVQFPERDNL